MAPFASFVARMAACATAWTVACATARDAGPPAQAPSTAAAVATAATADLEPEVDLDPGAALGRLDGEGEILVRTDVLRGHAVGAHLGPIVGTWPGWRATLRALARDPVGDLEWIDVVGPTDPGRGRLLARLADDAADAALDGRLVALQARSAEPAASHVESGVTAAAARLDGTLRVVFRAQPRIAAASPASRGVSLSHALARTRLHEPSSAPLEAVRADVPQPHELVRLVPPAIGRMRAHVFALPGGDADANADGECATADDAARAGASLRDTIARQNSALVRMLTHGLLDALAVTVEGTTVKMRLHATREQLEAVVGLVSAMIPGDADR
jgi:hypothetical protein